MFCQTFWQLRVQLSSEINEAEKRPELVPIEVHHGAIMCLFHTTSTEHARHTSIYFRWILSADNWHLLVVSNTTTDSWLPVTFEFGIVHETVVRANGIALLTFVMKTILPLLEFHWPKVEMLWFSFFQSCLTQNFHSIISSLEHIWRAVCTVLWDITQRQYRRRITSLTHPRKCTVYVIHHVTMETVYYNELQTCTHMPCMEALEHSWLAR